MSDEYTQAVADSAPPTAVKIQVWRWKTLGKGFGQPIIFMSDEYESHSDCDIGSHINRAFDKTKYQVHSIVCFKTFKHEGGSIDILQWRFELS